MVQIPHRLCETYRRQNCRGPGDARRAPAQPCASPAQARYVGIRPKHQSVESVDRRAGGERSKNFAPRAPERTSGMMHTRHEIATTGRVLLAVEKCSEEGGGWVGADRSALAPVAESYGTIDMTGPRPDNPSTCFRSRQP